MKKIISLTGLLLFAATGIFAATPLKPTKTGAASINKMVAFSLIPSKRGVVVKINNNTADKAIVTFYNYENDIVWKDVLTKKERNAESI